MDDESFLPKYQTEGAACMDLIAKISPQFIDGINIGSQVRLNYRALAIIETGISVAIPKGFKLCIAARSGLAAKGLAVMNAPGQIDEDYRGTIKVIVANITGRELITIAHGDRFAQCWLEPVYKVNWKVVKELTPTERGVGGLGSTGVASRVQIV